MDADKFNKWKNDCSFNQDDISYLLGIEPELIAAYESGETIIPSCVALACDYIDIIRTYQGYLNYVRCSSSEQKRYALINDIKGKILDDRLTDSDAEYINQNEGAISSWLRLRPHTGVIRKGGT